MFLFERFFYIYAAKSRRRNLTTHGYDRSSLLHIYRLSDWLSMSTFCKTIRYDDII